MLEPLIYLLMNKPRGIICTSDDPQGRKTFHDLLPKNLPARVYTVGRLDMDSEGLLLVTNDGELAHRCTHPRFGLEKKYKVVIKEKCSPAELRKLEQGVVESGETLKAEEVRMAGKQHGGYVYSVILREGRNRHIRRMFAALNRTVLQLKREEVGSIKLGRLASGQCRALSERELVDLRKDVHLVDSETEHKSLRFRGN